MFISCPSGVMPWCWIGDFEYNGCFPGGGHVTIPLFTVAEYCSFSHQLLCCDLCWQHLQTTAWFRGGSKVVKRKKWKHPSADEENDSKWTCPGVCSTARTCPWIYDSELCPHSASLGSVCWGKILEKIPLSLCSKRTKIRNLFLALTPCQFLDLLYSLIP